MKPKSRRISSLASLFAVVAFSSAAHAQSTLTWDQNAAGALQNDGAAAWLDASQWWNGATNVNWTSGDSAIFGNGSAGAAVGLANPTNVGSLSFNYFTGTYTVGTVGQAITLNGGLTMNPGAGVVTVVSPITLGAAQSWTNNDDSLLTIGTGAVSNGGFLLTVGGTGSTTVSGAIGGGGGLTKTGAGILTLSGGNGYLGATTVTGGVLRLSNATALSGGIGATGGTTSLSMNGGYVELANGNFQRGLGTGDDQVQITGGASGFSANGGARIVNLGGASAPVTWGTGSFLPSTFVLNGTTANNTLDFQNAIDLNGGSRTVFVGANIATISGAISNGTGTGSLTKTGVGTLTLTNANTYNGATTILGENVTALATNLFSNTPSGTLTLSGASGSITATSGLAITSGGTLRMVSTNTENTVDRLNSAAITVTRGGTVSWENTAGANSFAETIGAATVNSGQFNVNLATNQTAAGTQTLTLGGLTRNGSSAVTFSAAGTGPQITGNKNMIVVTGGGSTTAGEIIGSWATTGTAANAQTDYAVYNSDYVTSAGIAASAQSGWSTVHAAGSNYTMSALASGTLSTTRNINSLRSTNNSVSVTANNANIALASHTLAVGDVVTFSAATMPTGLAAGTPYFVVATASGTVQVSATAGGTAITPTTTGTTVVAAGGISLSTGNNLGTTGILNGSATVLNILATGTGSITLPTSGAGQLHINTGSAAIVSNAPIIDNGGALTLVKSGTGGLLTNGGNYEHNGVLALNGVSTYTGDTIINAGTLRVGISNTANGAKLGGATGIYAGNISIAAGAMLHISTDANQTLSGVISGEGTLMKTNSGTLTLSGNNTYTGKTSITPHQTGGAGTLVVSSFNSVNGGSPLMTSSSLGAPTTVANGTIDFGGPKTIQGSVTLRYNGSGEITDRVVNLVHGGNTTRTIDTSGSGLLKFTSPFTSSGTVGSSTVVLTGSSDGEIVHGLPFAVNNLTKSGNGTWTLGGSVGNTGLLTVNAGTLALQKKGSLMGGNMANWTAALINVKSGATLALNVDSSDTAGISAASLDTLLTNISVAGSAAAGLQSGARIGLDTSTATGGTFTQGNAIANSTGGSGGAIGVTKLGTGSLIFDKTNSYTGATIVSKGTLIVNGSISTSTLTTVASGATLGGNGAVGSATINGILAPGNGGIGTLSATGDTTWNSNQAWAFELGTASLDLASANIGGTRDLFNITGVGSDFLKGTGSAFTFDFANTGESGYYKLVDWDGTSTFVDADFAATNLASGLSGSFIVDSATSALYLNVNIIPEPSIALLGGLGALLLLRRKR